MFGATRAQTEYTAALSALMFGRPTMAMGAVATLPTLMFGRNALQDATPLCATLERLVDFDRLSGGDVRVLIGATALDPDEAYVFDSATSPLRPEHILASAALPVLFPPVTIEGELLSMAERARTYLSRRSAPSRDRLPIASRSIFSPRLARSQTRWMPRSNACKTRFSRFNPIVFWRTEPRMARPLRVLVSSYHPANGKAPARRSIFPGLRSNGDGRQGRTQ